MTRLITCGFETGYANGTGGGSDELHGLVWGGATNGSTVVANPSWWKSSGSYVLKNTAPGNRNPPFSLGNWVGFKFGVDGYPASESDIFFLSTAGSFSITLNPNGVINIWVSATGGIVYTSPVNTIKVQTCHLIEIQAVSGTQQWWLDGVMLFSYNSTNTNDVFATSPNFVLGGAAAGWYFDDFYANSAAASASNQTGRRGLASVRALVPNGDVGSSPAGFTNSAGLTFGNATTGWFSAIDDTPPFLAANADFIGKSTANTVVYENAFADTPNGVTPTAVSLVSIIGAASAAAAQVNVNLKANAIDGNNVSYAPAVTTPLIGFYAIDVASAGVAWTKALVDGATAKFGNSTDVTPNPKLFATYLMYETLDLPKIETITDTFDTTVDKTTKWSNSNAATVWDSASKSAKLPCATTYSQLATSATVPGYNLIGSSVYAKMVVPPTGSGSREMFMEVECNNAGTNKFSMFVSGGQLFGRRTIGGTQSGQLAVTYVPATHAWWRIRESAGTIYFDFSSDGSTWTNHYNVAAGMTYEAVWLSFTCGYYGTETADNGFVDNVNTPAAGGGVNTPVTLAATMTLTAALIETEVYKRTLAVAPVLSPVLVRNFKVARLVALTATFTPAIGRQAFFSKTFAVTSTLTPALVKKLLAPRAVNATVVLAPVLSMQKSKGFSFPLTMTLTPAITVKKSQGFILAASMTLISAMTRVPFLQRTFAAPVNFTVTQARKLSAFRTFAGTVALAPSMARSNPFSRTLSAAISFIPNLVRGIKLSRNFNASVTLSPDLSIGSGKTYFFNAVIVMAPALKKYIAMTLAAPLSLVPKIQRKSTMTMAAPISLNPSIGRKSLLNRIFASVAVIQADLQKGSGQRITLSTALPFNVAMIAGRANRVVLSVSAFFSAVVDFLRYVSRPTEDTLFSTTIDPAQLLAVQDPQEVDLESISVEDEEIAALLSASSEIPELGQVGEDVPSLRSVS